MARTFPVFVFRRVILIACAVAGGVLVLNALFRDHHQSNTQLPRFQLQPPSAERDQELVGLMNHAPPDVMERALTGHRNLVMDFVHSRPRSQWPLLVDPASVLVQLDSPLQDVSDHFLSVTLDSCAVQYNWSFIDFAARRVINMARALAPATLRVGGTHQGFLVFEPDGEYSPGLHHNQPTEVNCYPKREDRVKFPMTTAHFDAVTLFAREVGWDLVFGLNSLLRDENGVWVSTNAEKLLRYSASKGYTVNWQLGNGKLAIIMASSIL